MCGIFALLFMALIPPIGLVFGVVAIFLGFRGRRNAGRGLADNSGQATFGVVTGMVALCVSVAFLAVNGAFVLGHSTQLGELSRCLAHAHTARAKAVCQARFNRSLHSHHAG